MIEAITWDRLHKLLNVYHNYIESLSDLLRAQSILMDSYMLLYCLSKNELWVTLFSISYIIQVIIQVFLQFHFVLVKKNSETNQKNIILKKACKK